MGLLYDREYGPNGRMMLLHLNRSRDIIFSTILMELYTIYVLHFFNAGIACNAMRDSTAFEKNAWSERGDK